MDVQLAKESYKASRTALSKIEKLRIALGDRASTKELLSAYTSFRIGGPADLFVTARSVEELCQFVRLARQYKVPYFILGRGTNILVSDEGIRGLVIWNQADEFTTDFIAPPSPAAKDGANNLQCLLEAESGALLSALAHYTIRLGLAGLEWAIGIPGTLGGAIINNAGAFGSDMSSIVQEITLLDKKDNLVTWDAGQIGFGYRTSRLKASTRGEYVLLRAKLLLRREAIAILQARAEQYLAKRRETQPKQPSAGSVFVNPPGDYAGRLIEQAGLKGLRIGDAQVSPQHANFIVNLGQARASDVYALIQIVRERVYQQFQVPLSLEIQLVGEWPKSVRKAA